MKNNFKQNRRNQTKNHIATANVSRSTVNDHEEHQNLEIIKITTLGENIQVQCFVSDVSEVGLLNREDLAAEISSLQKLLSIAARRPFNEFPDELRQKLKYISSHIFAEPVREALRAHTSADHDVQIKIFSDGPILPWSLLTIDPASDDYIPLGSLAEIRCGLQLSNQFSEARTAIGGNQVDIMFGWCDQLNSAEAEINDIKNIDQNIFRPQFVRSLEAYPPNAVPIINALTSEDPKIIHLACHAAVGSTADQTYIRLRSGKLFTQQEMHNEIATSTEKLPFRGRFIFLNACEMGYANALKGASFINFILKEGADAIIAPFCAVSDKSAGSLAVKFYESFVESKSASRSLSIASQSHWNAGDWTGFLYNIYGRGNFRIVEASEA